MSERRGPIKRLTARLSGRREQRARVQEARTRPARTPGEAAGTPAMRIDAARERLRAEISPPEDDG